MTKDMKNVLNVLKAINENCRNLRDMYQNENNDKMYNHYNSITLEQNMIIEMIEKPTYLKSTAQIFDIELLK